MPADRVEFVRHIGEKLHRRRIDPDPWQERVLRSNARQKILTASRQVGKSTVVAGLTLHKAMFTPESLSLIFAPTERQAKEAFAKVSRFYLAAGGTIATASVRKMGLALENGSRIEAMPATENTIRGFTADLVVIDEAAYARDAFYDSILPSLAVSDGDLILASTPHGKRGFFYEEWASGEGWERYEVPATECPRISPGFLRAELHRMGERHHRQEYFCSFEESDDAVFTCEVIDAAFSDNDVEPLWTD